MYIFLNAWKQVGIIIKAGVAARHWLQVRDLPGCTQQHVEVGWCTGRDYEVPAVSDKSDTPLVPQQPELAVSENLKLVSTLLQHTTDHDTNTGFIYKSIQI